MRLTTLSESIIVFVWTFPNLSFAFRGSRSFAELQKMAAT